MKDIKSLIAVIAMLLCSVSAKTQTDVTSSILTPGFDGQGFGGWRNKGFWTQTNNSFSGKNYKAYAERWVASSSDVPDSYLLQTITGLPNGQYRLTAAAQNIDQTATDTPQTGAYIVGNGQTTTVTSANTYIVDFAVVDGTAEIGFYTESATGNWIACDNFRLSRLSIDISYLRSGLSALVTKGNTLTGESMQDNVLSSLASAISAASAYTSSGTEEQVSTAYSTLKRAIKDAENSIFYTRTLSGTGTAPTVTTDTRYAVGRNIAFGRSTVSSAAPLLEQGFCFSTTNPTPTLADDRSSRYIDHVGYIHVMDNLTPGTMYYIRAYAVTTGYKAAYGDVLRIYTLPSGAFSYNFNMSGDENIDARIKAAMDGVIGYWNQTTSITGFTPTANYASGTPTADCSYGGWIRFGPSEDYQAIGTAMHEVLHGIGVGTHYSYSDHMEVYSGGPGSSYGAWLGKRAKELTQFWDNNEGEFITGGGSHVWATNGSNMISYTINGAHEDTHSDLQYYGCGLLAQAMCEDGMVPAYGGFLPGYCFRHSDDTKYYIRNTNDKYGLNTSTYLTANGTTLKWATYESDAAATASDKAAWYITFDPTTQYYYFRNAATGKYIYYNGSVFSASGTAEDSNTQIHLHLAWWDATFGTGGSAVSKSTYYLMHPASVSNPACLAATTSNAVTTAVYNSAESQTASRWMIIPASEMGAIATASIGDMRTKVTDLIAQVRTMAVTTHTDDTGTANTTLSTTLSTIETAVATATASECEAYYNDVLSACKTFMGNTTPESPGYDITFLVSNPGCDTNEGWSGSIPGNSYSTNEFYQSTFDFYQTLRLMPAGDYRMKMQAYERPGTSSDVYTDYMDGGTDDYPVTTQIYISTATQAICDISVAAQASALGVGTESDVTYNAVTKYIPNNMQAGANYFSNNYYDNTVDVTSFEGGSLRFGIRNTTYVTADWTMFDNVRLYYLGGTGTGKDPAATADGYDITGAMAPYLSTAHMTDWTNSGFSVNGGAGQEDNNGDACTTWPFFEKWANNTPLANSYVEQTITELPNGTYYIGGSFIASWQADASVNVTGVTFYAGDQQVNIATANHLPERYSLRVTVSDGTLTYGLRTLSTNANWVAMDNLFLIYDGTEDEYLSNATADSPVRIPLANPRMEGGADNNFPGWTILNETTRGDGVWKTNETNSYANFTGKFMESWVGSSYSLTDKSALQNVTLKAGSYVVKAAVNAVRQNDLSLEVSGVTLNIGNKSVSCHTGNGTPVVFSKSATLGAGDYDIGLVIESTDANWVAWDNVILYYYGSDPYFNVLELCKEARDTYESLTPGAAQAAIDEYEWTYEEYNEKSNAEITEAIAILNNARSIASSSETATSLISNADFRGGTSSLGVQGSGGRVIYPSSWTFIRNYDAWNDTFAENGVFNAWAGVITLAELYQDISNLPNGTYRLRADIKVDTEDNVSQVALYGYGDGERVGRSPEAGSNISGSTNTFANYTCTFDVTNHTARIGIRSDHGYYQVKNISLEYMTDTALAARESDASYLRQDFFWSTALEFDATAEKYSHAEAVTLHPKVTNQIIKATTGQLTAPTTNVVIGGTCANLVITDGSPLQITSTTGTFTASNAHYFRDMGETYRWGTLILPLSIRSDADVTFYELIGVGDDLMHFRSIPSETSISANTPVIFRTKAVSTDLDIRTTMANVALTTDAQPDRTSATGWEMLGVYYSIVKEKNNGYYYIAQDKFWLASSKDVTIKPFRAFFQNEDADVKSFRIFIDDDTDGLIELNMGHGETMPTYDLQGRRATHLQKGIYIVNGRKTVIK